MYSDVSLFIDGEWTKAAGGRTIPVVNPATGEPIGTVAHAEKVDLNRALDVADTGFRAWRKVSAFDRSKLMREAAYLLRGRADAIGLSKRLSHCRGRDRSGDGGGIGGEVFDGQRFRRDRESAAGRGSGAWRCRPGDQASTDGTRRL
jgi:hypothetical protein